MCCGTGKTVKLLPVCLKITMICFTKKTQIAFYYIPGLVPPLPQFLSDSKKTDQPSLKTGCFTKQLAKT